MTNFLKDIAPAAPPAEKQRDGLPVQSPGNKPTKAGTIQGAGSPTGNYTSGIERALGALADKTHPTRKR